MCTVLMFVGFCAVAWYFRDKIAAFFLGLKD